MRILPNKKMEWFAVFGLFIGLIGARFLVNYTTDPFPDTELPVYPSAINPKRAINSPATGAKSVAYTVIMDFPRNSLTNFYNTEMAKIGYTPLPEKGIGTFKWEKFNYTSGKMEETSAALAQYTATWVNKDKSRRIWLYVAPHNDKEKREKNIFVVSCNMAKYFDFNEKKK